MTSPAARWHGVGCISRNFRESTQRINACAYDPQVGSVSGRKKAVEDPPPWRTLSFWLGIIVFIACIVGIWWYGIDQLPVPP
jgi:hypothetical protein